MNTETKQKGNKLKILIAADVFYPTTGGVPVAINSLAHGLKEDGNRVLVMAPSDGFKSHTDTYEGIDVARIASLPLNKKRSVRLPFNVIEIAKVISRYSPDVIHVCTPGIICESTVRIARRRNIPLVGTNHVVEDNVLSPFQLPAFVERFFGKILFWNIISMYRKLDKVAAPSHFAANHFMSRGLKLVSAISNGIAIDRFTKNSEREQKMLLEKFNLKKDEVILLYVGRLDKEKRVDVLLRAVSKVKGKNFKLLIAGGGVDEKKLRSLTKILRIEDRVSFIGYIENDQLPALYKVSDIFVMPGDAELQSISTLEAMASRLPVVACDSMALPDLVEDGVNGYLYKKNNAESCAEYLSKLILDSSLREKFGNSSFEKVKEHDMPNTVSKYERLYLDAIGEHKPRQ